MRIAAALAVALFAVSARADFKMNSANCKFVGMAPGKAAEPMVNPGSGFNADCKRTGRVVSCEMTSQVAGGKDAHTGTKDWTVKFEMEPVANQATMISDDHLNFVLLDSASKKFAWAQTFVDAENGVIFQKQCMGDYKQTK